MVAQPKKYITPEEYLAMERAAPTKSEYYRGEVFAMAGASWTHGIIVGNLSNSLRSRIGGRSCRIQTNDIKVRVGPGTAYSYPDVIGICTQPDFAGGSSDILTNPELVIEVLSPSTEFYDRNLKLVLYQEIPSLKDYILVAQDKILIEHYARGIDRWLDPEVYTLLEDTVRIASLGCEFVLSEIYEGVKFPLEPGLRERKFPASMRELIDQVKALLSEIDLGTSAFAISSRLACPEGCGQCCENPQVETTVLEALPLAYWLLTRPGGADEVIAKLMEIREGGEKRRCHFYGPTRGAAPGQGRCTVYGQRPGLCRLFGFAARLDRRGFPEPVICRIHRAADPGAVAQAYRLAEEGAPMPTYYEFSTQFALLDPQLGVEQLPINEAILVALEKVGLWLQYSGAEILEPAL